MNVREWLLFIVFISLIYLLDVLTFILFAETCFVSRRSLGVSIIIAVI